MHPADVVVRRRAAPGRLDIVQYGARAGRDTVRNIVCRDASAPTVVGVRGDRGDRPHPRKPGASQRGRPPHGLASVLGPTLGVWP
jgi:hypothetical protein